MKQPSPLKKNGFSLVEVALAIGIVAFALVAIIGLIPAGLNSMHDAIQQSRASEILTHAATEFRTQYPLTTSGTTTSPTDLLANDLSTKKSAWNQTYSVLDDGSIVTASGTTPYKLYVQVTPSSTATPYCTAYLSVAWPGLASYADSTGWTNQIGYSETFIYANPPASNY